MRLTYTDLLNQHFRNIGKAGQTSDSTLVADFQFSLGTRYQLILGALASYITQGSNTDTCVIGKQYYMYKPGVQSVDSVTVTVNDVIYPLTPIYDQGLWDMLNAIQIQPTVYPQFVFPRKDDYGLWPIPQGEYEITFNGFQRDRNLLVADVTSGTVKLTEGQTKVTGIGTPFTSGMKGRWFEITDTSVYGHGYFYRIASVEDALELHIDRPWNAPTLTEGKTYRIGESPEIPEEGHVILVAGTTADFYAGLRNNPTSATWWNNLFWTGDGNNNTRDEDDEKVKAGLIGLINRYKNRDRSVIIHRQPSIRTPASKIFGTTVSE